MEIIKEYLFWLYPTNEEFLWILFFCCCSIMGMIAFLSMFKELKAMQEEPEVKMSDESITVVFKCPADSVLRKEIMTAFKDDKPFKDAQITAVSLTDEISRVERFENVEIET